MLIIFIVGLIWNVPINYSAVENADVKFPHQHHVISDFEIDRTMNVLDSEDFRTRSPHESDNTDSSIEDRLVNVEMPFNHFLESNLPSGVVNLNENTFSRTDSDATGNYGFNGDGSDESLPVKTTIE